MGNVIMHNVVSVDGFIADENDEVGPLFDWYGNGDTARRRPRGHDSAQLKVSQASAEYVRPMWAAIGAMVIGRHLFDMTNGWEGRAARGRPRGRGVAPAQARGLAPRGVLLLRRRRRRGDRQGEGARRGAAPSRWRRATSAARRSRSGLVDEVAMDVVPVVFGSGKRYFGSRRRRSTCWRTPHVVIQGDRVLHLRYRVRR